MMQGVRDPGAGRRDHQTGAPEADPKGDLVLLRRPVLEGQCRCPWAPHGTPRNVTGVKHETDTPHEIRNRN